MRPRHMLAMAAALVGLLASPVQAADPGSIFRYTVRKGDTLYTLASKYLSKTADFQTVQRLNKVADPHNIPPGTILRIPDALLRTEPVVGQISAFRGAVTLDGRQVDLGAKVRQGMRVETGPNAFVTITLPDASAISLPSQSRIRVEKLRRVLLSGGFDRNFVLEAGRSRAMVTPVKDGGSNFRVTTPLSVSAVRGTDFRVALDPSGERALTEVVGGTVGVAPDEDKDEIAVPRAFGTVATPAGVESPVALLPGPKLLKVERAGNDGVQIAIQPVEGAVRYRTQLATDVAFQNVIAETVEDMPSASFNALGNVSFFVRLTAVAASGLEGLPATYALGARPVAVEPSADAGDGGTGPSQLSLAGHDRSHVAILSANPPLR